jgi:CubicO group peptidase (beta-lactamase class C family)
MSSTEMPPVPVEGRCEPRFERVRELFVRSIEKKQNLGAAVSFVVDGETVVDLHGGWIDRERTRPWQADTLVNVYSTTKGMTALCAHMLVDRGQLDLDAPVAEYWPEFAAEGKQDVPVRWLLSHRVGLPAVRAKLTLQDMYDWQPMVDALAAERPWWTPGSKHGYHAVTYGQLVGEVIRRVDGRSVGRFFREEVAEPLGVDFHIGLGPEHDARTSPLYGGLGLPKPARDALAREGQGGGAAAEGAKKGPVFKVKGPLGDFMRDMADPTTMTGAAFNNPRLSGDTVNSRDWRAAEVPAANGHGTARALARVYGVLARGGEQDGVELMRPETLDHAIIATSDGPDAVLGQLPMRFGLGFMLRQDFMPFSRGPRGFGHAGAGGSLGVGDPDARVGFGFTLNKMQMGLVGAPVAFEMLKAFYEEL